MTNGKEGLLAPPKNEQALALAIVRLLADAPMRNRLAAAGQETASRYAWPEIASRVLTIYEQALQTSAAPRLTGAL
jgi:glycosyltransferase involved in cell wall biosynthesis